MMSMGSTLDEEKAAHLGDKTVLDNNQLRDLTFYKDHFGLENFLNIFKIFYTLSHVSEMT